MYRHWFFDLDNTLTPSKDHIRSQDVPTLVRLCDRADVTVVSGHGEKDIRAHLGADLAGTYHILGQNGNYAETRDGKQLWNRSLSQDRKDAIHAFIAKAKDHLKIAVKDDQDLVEDRDSQIAYSLIGHHEDRDKKTAFDPRHEIRLKLLSDLAGDVAMLRDAGVEVRSGGTTVLDFFELGKNKGYNVAAFIASMGWKTDECIYLGDALFPGGNDETVIGIIPTHAVESPDDTFTFINEMLS
jgi:HAD superfamily hydrolase (TIGR01484 family)